MIEISDALENFHQAEAVRRFAVKQAREARNELLDAMHITGRHTTLGRSDDDRAYAFRKADVDENERLSPTQRKRLRAIRIATK